MKGMTFTDANRCHPYSLHQALFFKGLDRIFGACGCESAGWRQHRRDRSFVESQQRDAKCIYYHDYMPSGFWVRRTVLWRIVSTAFNILPKSAVVSCCRATNTTSYPKAWSFSTRVMHSRSCRLSLFLFTAFASFLLTEIPILKFSVPFFV